MVRRDITMRILPTMCMLFLSLCFQVTASPKEQGERRVSIDADNTTIKEILKRIENQTGVAFFYNTNHVNDKERVSVNVRDIRFEDLMKEIFRKRGISWSYNDDVVTLQTSLAEQGKKRVSFTAENITLKDVFKIIQKQTGLEFYYNVSLINVNDKITLEVKDRPLDEVLEKILTVRGLDWQYYDKIIRIRSANKSAERDSSITTLTVTGKVTDAVGNPIPGATIIVKGTTDGTTSNEAGEFSLPGVAANKVLVIRSVGYQVMEIPVGRKSIKAQLTLDIGKLDETVVIGYGTSSKRMLTGNVGKVDSKEIANQPISNPLAALQGRIPGIQITQLTGVPGGGFTVQIRGRNSLRDGANDPLYIIDGVPFSSSSLGQLGFSITNNGSPLSVINPYDIESIEVLKDADATSIYGSRGANGVVLITTKKGKVGELKVDFNFFSGIGKVTRMMELLNTEQYVEMRNEAFSNDGLSPSISNAYDLLVWDTTKYTDWQRKFIGGTAHFNNAQVSLSGGGSNTQYLIGANYNRETTVFPGKFADKKASFNMNLSNSSKNKKLKTNVSVIYSLEDNNLFPNDLLYATYSLPPNAPDLISESGELNWPSYLSFNPLTYLHKKYRAQTDNFISNAVVRYEIIPGLELKTSLGYNKVSMSEIATSPIASNNPADGILTGSTTFGDNSIKTWIIEPQITWSTSIAKGILNLLLGSTFQESVKQSSVLEATGYNTDALLEDIKSAASIIPLNSEYSKYRYGAIFGRVNYNWADKYIANITARRDGSSRFGPGKQFSTFAAVGAAWIFSNERLVRDNASFISFGKLRGSYGTSGNDAIQDYGYLDLWEPTSYPYQGYSSLYPSRLSNPRYAWERNKKLEAAIEVGFLKDRIYSSFSWYRNKSDNQLVGYPLPPSVGFANVQANLPAVVQNVGYEAELRSTNFQTKAFSWVTVFNITIPTNKLIAFPDIEASSYRNLYSVGKSLDTRKMYQFTGVDPKSGQYTFLDANNDGRLSISTDGQFLKKVSQRYYGGLSNTFSYRGLELAILLQFVKQTGRTAQFLSTGMPGMRSNQTIYVMDRWRGDGDISTVQKYSTGSGSGSSAYRAWVSANANGDNRIEDASFIRAKNVALSYRPPEHFIRKYGLKAARFYIQCQNLLTITSYKGLDPENQSITSLPPLRMLTMGIQLTL